MENTNDAETLEEIKAAALQTISSMPARPPLSKAPVAGPPASQPAPASASPSIKAEAADADAVK
eukprot:1302696-Prymnesium_polylepis.1